jgi:hypothetical protein
MKALVDVLIPASKRKTFMDSLARTHLSEQGEFVGDRPIEVMLARHHYMLLRMLSGADNRTIAEEGNLTETRVKQIQSSPAFQREYKRLAAKAEGLVLPLAERVNLVKDKAFDVLEAVLHEAPEGLSPPEKALRVKVAQDVLNRTGEIPPIERREVAVAHLTKADIEDMKRRASGKVLPGDTEWGTLLSDGEATAGSIGQGSDPVHERGDDGSVEME